MDSSSCFWALLSVKDLVFIHTSTLNKLKGVSLFDLFHPSEVLLAKRDLYKFIDANLLGGSVTRCRLKDNAFTAHNNTTTITTGYIIIDIIMYVATKDLVLTFFHRPQSNTCCVEDTTSNTISIDKHTLQSHATANTKSNSFAPRQFIHILENRTKSVLLSWPDHYPNEMFNGSQMDYYYYLDDRPMSPTTTTVNSCFHCVQNPIRFNFGQRVSSIQIQYGNIKFILVQEEEIHNNNSSQSRLTLSLPPSPMYHYKQQQQQKNSFDSPTTKEKKKRHVSPTPLVQRRKEQLLSHPYSAPSSPIVSRNNTFKLENLLSPVITTQQQQQQQQRYSSPYQYHHRNQCQSCGTDSSPEWRRGPTGHKTLCNACGLRYSRSVARQGKIQQQQKLLLSQRRSISPQSPLSSCSSTSCSYLPTTVIHQQHHTISPQQQQQPYYNSRTYYSVL